jgi:hypothetical protein
MVSRQKMISCQKWLSVKNDFPPKMISSPKIDFLPKMISENVF